MLPARKSPPSTTGGAGTPGAICVGSRWVATGLPYPKSCLALAWAQKDQDSVGYQQVLYIEARGVDMGEGSGSPAWLSQQSSRCSTASVLRGAAFSGGTYEDISLEAAAATASHPLPALLLRPPTTHNQPLHFLPHCSSPTKQGPSWDPPAKGWLKRVRMT